MIESGRTMDDLCFLLKIVIDPAVNSEIVLFYLYVSMCPMTL